jgi:hypothetical protein
MNTAFPAPADSISLQPLKLLIAAPRGFAPASIEPLKLLNARSQIWRPRLCAP